MFSSYSCLDKHQLETDVLCPTCLWIQEAVCLIFKVRYTWFPLVSSLNSLKSHRKVEMTVHTSGLLEGPEETDTPSEALRRVSRVVKYAKCSFTLLFVQKGSWFAAQGSYNLLRLASYDPNSTSRMLGL